MAGIGIILKLVGTKRILGFLTSKDTVGKPAKDGLKKLALQAKAQLIKATVVAEGTARSNIAAAPIQYAKFTALVTHGPGPGSSYIPYLQRGTSRMDARHMKGSVKVTGKDKGMFTFVKKWLDGKVNGAAKSMAKDIEDEL